MKELDNKKRNKYITSMGKNIQFIKLEKEIKELIVGDERAEWLNFSKNEIIYGYDSYKKSLGIILKGKVSVRKDRTSNVLINTLGNGDIFGGAALFSKYDRFIGTLRAETDSDILFIPENLMEEIIVKSPESAVSYIKYLSESLMFLNNRLPFLSNAFGFEHISIAEYAVAMGLAFLIIPIMEIIKAIERKIESKK